MGVGDYDEALVQLNATVADLELTPEERLGQGILPHIIWNLWSDPRLEEPEFVEVRERLRVR